MRAYIKIARYTYSLYSLWMHAIPSHVFLFMTCSECYMSYYLALSAVV